MRHVAKWVVGLGFGALVLGASLPARADEASVTVGRIPSEPARFAEPPARNDAPIVPDDDRGRDGERRYERERYRPELCRSPLRLQLGPAGVTTGKGFGMGMNLAADFGSGTVGARFAAAWLRGEGRSGDTVSASPLGTSIGQYTGEMTLDFHKRGPLHPLLGLGVGLVHVSRPEGSGVAGIGTGRLGLEYALGLDDADVRFGGSVTGVLAGPADDELTSLRGYMLVAATLSIGF